MKHILSIAVLMALSACASVENNAVVDVANDATPSAPAMQSYGETMPEMESAPLATAWDGFAKASSGQPIKLSGRVGQVCQVKGCWMMLTDGDKALRIKFGDHLFMIPKDAQGEAIAYGTLEVKEMSLAESKHMAEDAGIDPKTITEPQKEYRLSATSLIIKG